MKVYISGKIGEEVLSEATRHKFARAEELLKARGYEVFNPTTSGLGQRAEDLAKNADYETSFYQEILLIDLVQLAQCDGIYMLGDWEYSPGAKLELHFAVAMGKRRFWEREFDALVSHRTTGGDADVWLPIE